MGDKSSSSSARTGATESGDHDYPENPRPKNYFYPADKIHLGETCLRWHGLLQPRYDSTGEIITPPPQPAVRLPGHLSAKSWSKYGMLEVNPYRPHVSVSNYLQETAKKWDAEFAEDYLRKFRGTDLPNPLATIPEVLRACERLRLAADRHERVLIYGDYDCDGVVSTTLMTQTLRALEIPAKRIMQVIPHRIQDGYNLNWEVLKRHLDECGHKVGLVIAVDCGSTAVGAARQIREAGMDLLVVDHHNLDATHSLPPDDEHLIHINPKLWLKRSGHDSRFRLENMCASGLVYLLARTLADQCGPDHPWSHSKAVLLAGLATCVDVMKLTGLNRLLLKESLRLANQPGAIQEVPALLELKKRKGPKDQDLRPVTEQDYGMSWGPVINAPGRMDTAELALKFVMAKDSLKAHELFEKCDQMNRFRKATERAMLHEAGLLIDEDADFKKNGMVPGREGIPANRLPPVLVVSHPHWHPGVVGILASRLRERHLRPTVVNTLQLKEDAANEGDQAKWVGSGRSIGNTMHPMDLGNAFHALAGGKKILKGGGHPMAGGLSFSGEQSTGLAANLIDAYRNQIKQRQCIDRSLEEISSDADQNGQREKLIVEVGAAASDFNPETWADIFERMRPFGNGNPCPPLLVEAAELLSVEVRTTNRFAPLGRPDFGDADGVDDEQEGKEEHRVIKEDAAWLLTVDSISAPRDLVSQIYRKNRHELVARSIREKLSEEGVEALKRCHAAKSDDGLIACLSGLVDDLNKILLRTSLYEKEVFKNVKLRPQTRHLLAQNLGTIRMLELNRLLFEDAFPKVVKVKNIRMPKVCAYMANFEDKITGKQIKAVWTDLERAEVLWQPYRFIIARKNQEKPPMLPVLFRLQLALQAYIDSKAMSDIYRGRKFNRRHLFQVLQCEPLPWENDPRRLRMPVMRRPKYALNQTLKFRKALEESE